MPAQPVKVDDCFVGGVFSVDADFNIATRGIKREAYNAIPRSLRAMK
jgi:hypothetical protein